MDILIEANHWAQSAGGKLVLGDHVEKAIKQRKYRSSLAEDQYRELIQEDTIHAIAFYIHFDLDRFLHPQTWRMAAGQAFFSLGVGAGVLITYGSYIPRNVNILASATAVTVTNSAISLIAGVAVFSIIFTFGIAPNSGSQLSFTAFPKVFEDLEAGRVLAPFVFGVLFVAAFSSCYSIVAVVVAPLRDEVGCSDKTAALIAVGATVLLGIPSALSFTSFDLSFWGRPFLEWVNQITGT